MYESACFMAPLTEKLVVFEENLAIILELEAFVEKNRVGGGSVYLFMVPRGTYLFEVSYLFAFIVAD